MANPNPNPNLLAECLRYHVERHSRGRRHAAHGHGCGHGPDGSRCRRGAGRRRRRRCGRRRGRGRGRGRGGDRSRSFRGHCAVACARKLVDVHVERHRELARRLGMLHKRHGARHGAVLAQHLPALEHQLRHLRGPLIHLLPARLLVRRRGARLCTRATESRPAPRIGVWRRRRRRRGCRRRRDRRRRRRCGGCVFGLCRLHLIRVLARGDRELAARRRVLHERHLVRLGARLL